MYPLLVLNERSTSLPAEDACVTSRGDRRRRQLLQVALRLFAERGWENTTIRDVANEAGVAQGLIYHYFDNKMGLLRAVIENGGLMPEVCQILGPSYERPAREVLLEVARSLYRLLEEKEEVFRLLLRETITNPEAAEAWRAVVKHGVEHLSRYLAARVAEGELRPHHTEVSARMLLHTVAMFQFHRVPIERLSEVVETMLYGVAVPEEREGSAS
jgi:AcrR family transcriptional regulator